MAKKRKKELATRHVHRRAKLKRQPTTIAKEPLPKTQNKTPRLRRAVQVSKRPSMSMSTFRRTPKLLKPLMKAYMEI